MEPDSTVTIELDKSILETTEIDILNTLLDMKICSLKTQISQKVDFDPSFLLNDKTVNPNILSETLEKAYQVCNNRYNFLNSIEEYIANNYKAIIPDKVITLLKFLITQYNNNLSHTLFTNFSAEFVHIFLLDALSKEESKTLAYETLMTYFKIFSINEQLICLNATFEFCVKNNNLDIFCGLLNHIPTESLHKEGSCFKKDTFWLHVQSCISGSESHLQKQGEYILTKYIQSISDSQTKNHLFFANDFDNSWQAFFILIDVGREKQLHLVEPCLDFFKYIYNLPFLWQKCVYKIYLRHVQLFIVYKVAIEILKRSFSGNDLREIISLIFPAINKNEYNILSCEMFNTLEQFCLKLSEKDVDIVIEELVKVAWNPISFWKVIQSTVSDQIKYINPDLIQELICCASNLPHLYIRTECIKYLLNKFWDEMDFNKMYKITSSLKLLDLNKTLSEAAITSVIDDLLKGNLYDSKKIKLFFNIIKHQKISVWSYVNNNDYFMQNSPFALFIWLNYLQFHNTEARTKIERFSIKYYKNFLSEDTVECFIDFQKLLFSKYILSQDLITELVYNPILSPTEHNETQLYVALILVQECLYHKQQSDIFLNMQVDLKKSGNTLIINFNKNQKFFSCISTNSSKICCECINIFFHLQKSISPDHTKNVLEVFHFFFESESNKVLLMISKHLYNLLLFSESEKSVIDFIGFFHTYLTQIKRDQYFKGIINEFIRTIYSDIYFKIENVSSINNSLINLSESYPLIRLIWIKSLRNLCSNPIYCDFCLTPLLELYLQGTIITKDERTEFHLCQEFLQNSNEPFILGENSNPNLVNAASRLLILDTLRHIARQNSDIVIKSLIERYMLHFKERHFPHSEIHYEKLRIVQALLIVICDGTISDEQTKDIRYFALSCFEEEANQNCVQQLLKWILILTLKSASDVIEWITSRKGNISTLLISLFPTLYHLTMLGSEDEYEKIIQLVLPWTMGAQFKLRVYAQDFISRILKNASRQKNDNFFRKYRYLNDCINNCIQASGDVFQNTLKSDLIFINDFDPIRDQKMSTMLCDIPRLNNVHPAEWLNLNTSILHDLLQVDETFLKEGLYAPSDVSFVNAINNYLSKTEPSDKVTKIGNEFVHIQKKITPWKSALENEHASLKTDFILVASLINKSQNLGGLSRTCEVFGISSMIFNDVKVMDDKEFKSLSMSSEAWIKATEVKIKNLAEYLIKIRTEGYCVIGAEQTAGSKKLNEFKFPLKMALVLGNEKTGIPSDIIPLLDVCLEIPQLGQTRSLNVHVAGATFIWEYAKQHLV